MLDQGRNQSRQNQRDQDQIETLQTLYGKTRQQSNKKTDNGRHCNCRTIAESALRHRQHRAISTQREEGVMAEGDLSDVASDQVQTQSRNGVGQQPVN